jgi:hypothetical protein
MTSKDEAKRMVNPIDIYDCERAPEIIKGMDNFLTIKGGGNILRGTEDIYSLPHMEQRFRNQTDRMALFNHTQGELQNKATELETIPRTQNTRRNEIQAEITHMQAELEQIQWQGTEAEENKITMIMKTKARLQKDNMEIMGAVASAIQYAIERVTNAIKIKIEEITINDKTPKEWYMAVRDKIKDILKGDQIGVRATIRQRIFACSVVGTFQQAHARLEYITDNWNLLIQLQTLYEGDLTVTENELIAQYKRIVRHHNLIMLQNTIRPHTNDFTTMSKQANEILAEEIPAERTAQALETEAAVTNDNHLALQARNDKTRYSSRHNRQAPGAGGVPPLRSYIPPLQMKTKSAPDPRQDKTPHKNIYDSDTEDEGSYWNKPCKELTLQQLQDQVTWRKNQNNNTRDQQKRPRSRDRSRSRSGSRGRSNSRGRQDDR